MTEGTSVERALEAYQQFANNFYAVMERLKNGEDGSTDSRGDGLELLLSQTIRGGELIGYVTASLRNSGEIPDTSALCSAAENMGLSQEGIIATVLSLMFLMDGTYCGISGQNDLVDRILNAFIADGAQRTTLESMRLKTPTTPDNTPSPVQVAASVTGKKRRPARSSKSTGKTKKGKKKTPKKARTSSGKKVSAGRRRKSKRK